VLKLYFVSKVPYPVCARECLPAVATVAPTGQYAYPPATYDLAMIGAHHDPFITATYDYTKYPTVPMNPGHPIYTSQLAANVGNADSDESSLSSGSSRNSSSSQEQPPPLIGYQNEIGSEMPPSYDQIDTQNSTNTNPSNINRVQTSALNTVVTHVQPQ
jgi:hypothetical protein